MSSTSSRPVPRACGGAGYSGAAGNPSSDGAECEPVEFICFASQHDNMIVPRDGQVLDCAEAVWFERIGHLAMTDNDQVLAKLMEVVERPLPEATATSTGAITVATSG
jgi:hypothetical protein